MKVPKDIEMANRSTYMDGHDAGRLGHKWEHSSLARLIRTSEQVLKDPRRSMASKQIEQDLLYMLMEKKQVWDRGFRDGYACQVPLKGGLG